MDSIKPIASSWESTVEELKKKNYYALWNDKKNKIQQSIWQLAFLVYNIIEKNKQDKNYLAARWHIVRGLASCTWWWASGRRLGQFSPIAWNPDEVEKGVNEFIRALRSLENRKLKSEKIKAEKLNAKIREMIWIWHWENF